jgi:hypothetical protein
MAEVVEFPFTPSGEAETGTVAVPERTELAEVVEGVVVEECPAMVQSVVLHLVKVIRIVV